jgi:hypothetical protein
MHDELAGSGQRTVEDGQVHGGRAGSGGVFGLGTFMRGLRSRSAAHGLGHAVSDRMRSSSSDRARRRFVEPGSASLCPSAFFRQIGDCVAVSDCVPKPLDLTSAPVLCLNIHGPLSGGKADYLSLPIIHT